MDYEAQKKFLFDPARLANIYMERARKANTCKSKRNEVGACGRSDLSYKDGIYKLTIWEWTFFKNEEYTVKKVTIIKGKAQVVKNKLIELMERNISVIDPYIHCIIEA